MGRKGSGEADVLVVGAGPVGLTAAAELHRRGVDCRIVDALEAPPQYAKAVGIQPRTLEVWDDMGIAGTMLDASTEFEGQILFVNGAEVGRMTLDLPADVPYSFVGLPQYETERLLAEHLGRLGGEVERGVELRSLAQDPDGVTVLLGGPDGEETLRFGYVVGCDGAHSATRKALGIAFEGDRFPEEYMLADVEVGWSFPHSFTIRVLHQTEEGTTDDMLICIPLPGRGRYRMSMLVPPELAGSGVDHGFASDRPTPALEHVQAVLDRLAPEPTTARNIRWSSIFRVSHRLVERYSDGRVFLCGDAAHIHPPTGAQGMNTGIQDAYNLAWKLALAVRGAGAEGLLESYHAERHPVGEEVVGRTVRAARAGFQEGPDDPSTVVRRLAQLLVGYPDSLLVAGDGAVERGPRPGERAPDAPGLRRRSTTFPARLFDLLRGRDHVLLLYGDDEGALAGLESAAGAARERAGGQIDVHAVLAAGLGPADLQLPVVTDADGAFRQVYGASASAAFLIRPDGYLAYRAPTVAAAGIESALGRVFS
jgi:pentachlorophenol monooxygenase